MWEVHLGKGFPENHGLCMPAADLQHGTLQQEKRKTAESAVFRCRLQTVYWPAVSKLPEIFAPGKVQTVGLAEGIHDARGLWVWPEPMEFGTPKTPSDMRLVGRISAKVGCPCKITYLPAVSKPSNISPPGKVQTVGLPEGIQDARGLWVWPEHVEFGTPKTPSDMRRRSVGGAMQKYVLAHGFGRVQDTRMGLSVGGASRQGLSRKLWFVHACRRPAAWHSAAGKAKNG